MAVSKKVRTIMNMLVAFCPFFVGHSSYLIEEFSQYTHGPMRQRFIQ